MNNKKVILENKTIQLDESGLIKIYDERMDSFKLEFESVKLSKKDLDNIQNYNVNKEITNNDPFIDLYKTLEDYIEIFRYIEKLNYNKDDPFEFFRDDEEIYIEVKLPTDLEGHKENIQRILKYYNVKEEDNFVIEHISVGYDCITFYTNLTKIIKEEYDYEYDILGDLKNTFYYREEEPMVRLWEGNKEDNKEDTITFMLECKK